MGMDPLLYLHISNYVYVYSLEWDELLWNRGRTYLCTKNVSRIRLA